MDINNEHKRDKRGGIKSEYPRLIWRTSPNHHHPPCPIDSWSGMRFRVPDTGPHCPLSLLWNTHRHPCHPPTWTRSCSTWTRKRTHWDTFGKEGVMDRITLKRHRRASFRWGICFDSLRVGFGGDGPHRKICSLFVRRELDRFPFTPSRLVHDLKHFHQDQGMQNMGNNKMSSNFTIFKFEYFLSSCQIIRFYR